MKQFFKKSVALLLTVLMVMSIFATISFSAASNKLVISECDSLDNWSGSNLTVTTNAAQACGSAAAINRDAGFGFFTATYTPAAALDISAYDYVEWDMMFYLNGDTVGAGNMWEKVKAAYGPTPGNNQFLMKATSQGTNNERAIWFFSKLEITQPYSNKDWVHFRAKLNDANTNASFDPSKVTSFLFTTCNAGTGSLDSTIGDGRIRIDNIYATKEIPAIPGDATGDGIVDVLDIVRLKRYIAGATAEIAATADMNSNGVINAFDLACAVKVVLGLDYSSDVEVVKSVVINDCESIDGWVAEAPATGLQLNANRGTDGKGAIYAYGGYGALRKITYTPAAALDLSGMTAIEWDQYTVVSGGDNNGLEQFEAVYNAYKDTAAVVLNDGEKTAVLDTSKWYVGEVGTGNYRHIAASLADADINLKNITSIAFYTLALNTGNVVNTIPNAVFRFDNIIATANAITPNWNVGGGDDSGEESNAISFTTCESAEGWSYENTGAAISHANDANAVDGGYIGMTTGYGALRKITYTPASPLDISGNSTIEWDMVVAETTGGSEYFYTATSAYEATTFVSITDGTNTATVNVANWQVGEANAKKWRHIAASFEGTNVDLSNITAITFATCPITGGTLDTTLPGVVYKFDGVKATANKVIPNWESTAPEGGNGEAVAPVIITTCETKDNWTYENTGAAILHANDANGIDGGYIGLTTGYGALRKITYTPNAALDLSETTTIEWDMVVSETTNGTEYFYNIAEAYKDTTFISITDGTKTATVNVSNWQVDAANAKKWRHLSASFKGADVDLSNIMAITIATCPITGGTLNTNLPGVVYRIDGLKATNNTVVPSGDGAGDNSGTAFMPAMFSDGMLFQQNKPMNVWGMTDAANEAVTVNLYKGTVLQETKTATSDSEGNWSVALSAREGGYDEYSLDVSAGNQSKKINNILIGELWIASGQSNMEFFLGNSIPKAEVEYNQYVRVFKEPSVPTADGANGILSSVPTYDIIPDTNNANTIGRATWTDGDDWNDIKYVSAVAYHTCNNLQKKLGVPVGFFNTAKGASVIEAWLSRESIDNNATVKNKLTQRGEYKSAAALNTAKNWQYMTTLYNTKLAPLAGLNADNEKRSQYAGFNVAGVLWYQGESNIKYAEANGDNTYYTAALNQLIDDWSLLFGFNKGEIPFVFADIAPYNYNTVRANDYDIIIAKLIEAMAESRAAHSNTIQIPLYDLPLTYTTPTGAANDPIHPSVKLPVGNRFADAIYKEFYSNATFEGPVFKSSQVSGNKIVLTFDNVGSGLKAATGTTLYGFTICGVDRKFVNADAKILSANTVEVSSPYVASPVAAAYAFSSYNMKANLVSSAGIPCIAFRTDKVDSVFLGVDDWMSCDFETVWSSYPMMGAAYGAGKEYQTWTAETGVTFSFDTAVKDSGAASLKVVTTAANKSVSPNFDLPSMRNHLNDYKYIAVTVKNDDNVQKSLSLKISDSYVAKTVDGADAATLGANSGFTTYIFDISALYLNGNQVSNNIYNNLFTANNFSLDFEISAAGTIHIDSIRLATEY